MKANYSLDDALKLFNQEIEKTQKELDVLEEEKVKCRKNMLSSPISSDLRLRELRIYAICTKELLDCLIKSRDRLLEEMTEVYL